MSSVALSYPKISGRFPPTSGERESFPSEKAPAPAKPVVMEHGLQPTHTLLFSSDRHVSRSVFLFQSSECLILAFLWSAHTRRRFRTGLRRWWSRQNVLRISYHKSPFGWAYTDTRTGSVPCTPFLSYHSSPRHARWEKRKSDYWYFPHKLMRKNGIFPEYCLCAAYSNWWKWIMKHKKMKFCGTGKKYRQICLKINVKQKIIK